MGRKRTKLEGITSVKAVRERLKDKSLKGWQRQRLQVAQMLLEENLTLPEIAEGAGVGARTVSRVQDVIKEGGLEKLLVKKAKGKGPESWLTKETEERLKAKLDEGQLRRGEDARKWLEKEMGRKLSLVVVYKYLGKCEARLKVPRPHHTQQKPEAVDTFRKTLCDQLHGKNVPFEEKVHIWVIDEMRFGLQPVTRRVWTRRGVEVVVPVHPRYQWGYTYGGLEICGNKAEFLHTDGVSQEATAMFYQQLAESDPESTHIIIADGAGFHLKEGDERMPSNVRVITLPAYSPELNPIEKLWDIVKDRICNRVWPDLEQLRAAIDGVLQEYWTTPELVRSLLGSGTVPSEANTTARTVLAF